MKTTEHPWKSSLLLGDKSERTPPQSIVHLVADYHRAEPSWVPALPYTPFTS